MDKLTSNIAYLLDSKKITANKLLEITNHSSTGLVAMWKSGERNMRTDDVVKLANYLNVTIDDLVNGDLRVKKNNFDELEILFSKHKDILTDEDKEYIRFIVEKRKREIDKQNHND